MLPPKSVLKSCMHEFFRVTRAHAKTMTAGALLQVEQAHALKKDMTKLVDDITDLVQEKGGSKAFGFDFDLEGLVEFVRGMSTKLDTAVQALAKNKAASLKNVIAATVQCLSSVHIVDEEGGFRDSMKQAGPKIVARQTELAQLIDLLTNAESSPDRVAEPSQGCIGEVHTLHLHVCCSHALGEPIASGQKQASPPSP